MDSLAKLRAEHDALLNGFRALLTVLEIDAQVRHADSVIDAVAETLRNSRVAPDVDDLSLNAVRDLLSDLEKIKAAARSAA